MFSTLTVRGEGKNGCNLSLADHELEESSRLNVRLGENGVGVYPTFPSVVHLLFLLLFFKAATGNYRVIPGNSFDGR